MAKFTFKKLPANLDNSVVTWVEHSTHNLKIEVQILPMAPGVRVAGTGKVKVGKKLTVRFIVRGTFNNHYKSMFYKL
jgi:hypothetical protein